MREIVIGNYERRMRERAMEAGMMVRAMEARVMEARVMEAGILEAGILEAGIVVRDYGYDNEIKKGDVKEEVRRESRGWSEVARLLNGII